MADVKVGGHLQHNGNRLIENLYLNTNERLRMKYFKGINTILFNRRHLIKWRIRRSTKVKCKIFHITEIGCTYLYLENKSTMLGGVGDDI